MLKYWNASHRGLIQLSGPDRVSFLQGLVTNDVTKVSSLRGIYAALLSPQGKFQFDLFITEVEDSFWIECEKSRQEDLIKRLTLFKLRSKVTLTPIENSSVILLMGEDSSLPSKQGDVISSADRIILRDPRHEELGWRVYGSPPSSIVLDTTQEIEEQRISLGIPDGTKDMIVDKSIPLECGFHELHAIDWNKGCYMGQELTARTFYRGLIRKRLFPVKLSHPLLEDTSIIYSEDGEVGRLASHSNLWAIAHLRSEMVVGGQPLQCGGVDLVPHIPSWMQLEPTPH